MAVVAGERRSAAISCVDNRLRKENSAAGQSALSYLPKMFFPKLYFVPIVTRTLLRPPSSKFEKKL